MRFFALLVLTASVVAQAQDAERAPPRGLLKRGLHPKGKATTTTTPAPPLDESEYVDEAEYPAEGEAGGDAGGDAGEAAGTEAPPSSTEGKKLGVRPFRSNADLLETLKRRRAQAAQAKHGHSASTAAQPEEPTEAPVKATYKKKGYGSASRDEEAPAAAPSKPTRNRFSRPGKSIVPEPEEGQEQAAAAPAPAPARAGRTFTRLRN